MNYLLSSTSRSTSKLPDDEKALSNIKESDYLFPI